MIVNPSDGDLSGVWNQTGSRGHKRSSPKNEKQEQGFHEKIYFKFTTIRQSFAFLEKINRR
jgi:hypothetical protein